MYFLDNTKAYIYFKKVFDIKKTSQNWYAFDCPMCGKVNKAAVKFSAEMVKCWYCSYKQNIVQFVMDYHEVEKEEAEKILDQQDTSIYDSISIEFEGEYKKIIYSDVKLPLHSTPILYGSGTLADRARKYLKGRGFNINLLDSMGVCYVDKRPKDKDEQDYFGYLIIPLKSEGKLVYFQARNFLGSPKRYIFPKKELFGVGKSELLYNEDALFVKERVFLTEGFTDAWTMGPSGMGSMGIQLSPKQIGKILRSPCDEVVFVWDAGFLKESYKAALHIADHKKVKVLELKGGDPNELGSEYVMDLYRNADYLSKLQCLRKLMEL